MRTSHIIRGSLPLVALALAACGGGSGGSNGVAPAGDEPVVATHLDQVDIESGAVALDELLEHGGALFAASFNTLDGAGRPEATGTGGTRPERSFPENFNRVSAPDANSCGGCHNIPRVGGGGDNVANVFVLGQQFGFVNFDEGEGDSFVEHHLDDVANERNTLGMFGAGFIELLAREMSTDLIAIRAAAIAQAALDAADVTVALESKGVSFGSITAHPDGTLDSSAVEGVDADLVIKPFHQKGVVVSLRQFSNNAMNHHHGLQASERFGAGVDHDADGLADELTAGDITAVTLWQATLPAPGRVLPNDPDGLQAVAEGETLFAAIGCAGCHVPELVLGDPVFSEPNPFNPTGNLQEVDVAEPVLVDLTSDGPPPHPGVEADGSVIVRAFTDLKRHDMGTGNGLDNEILVQGGVPVTEFLTKKLWGMSNEPPYMHHGRALTIDEAILLHAGEADDERVAYEALNADEQDALVEFLQTLQVLPEGERATEVLAPWSGILGDDPAVLAHVDQDDVDGGVYSPEILFALGEVLFKASFNTLDGAGRPATTGTGGVRTPVGVPDNFNRISAPDANSCAGCHNVPRSGGGGDNVANVFVLAQQYPLVNFDGGEGDAFTDLTLDTVGDERNTLGMFGSGYIELLAREMTADLQAIRDDAIAQAALASADVTLPLVSKGVAFGAITALGGGGTDTSAVEGVDADLIVKPFHQKGVVISLRQFSNNAMNHHHGMQSSERFGDGVDHDADGLSDELTDGDMTAVALYQAMLPVPGRLLPAGEGDLESVERGEALFDSTGCTACHVPSLVLDDPVFSEPNPYNPSGNLQVADVPAPLAFDLTTHGVGPRLPREADGTVLVPAYTDLKRHDMGPDLDNETVVQGGVPTSVFLTRKLWGMANEPPFLHHGRALTIQEAIEKHGGEALAARQAFEALSAGERASVVDFLKTLQVLPANSPLEMTED